MSAKNDKKILVIVESPGKISKLNSILGEKYIVDASVGHIIEIKDVDIENNFKPSYDVIKGSDKKQSRTHVVNNLKQLAKNADEVILATDEDREGEMIAWSLAYVLKLKNAKRIVFNSITKEEIMNAIKNAKLIDMSMVNAQKSRSILDRIIGFELSSILQKNVKLGKSAGRVQSVVTRLIVDQEKKIDEFYNDDISSYFKMNATFISNMRTTLYTSKNIKNKDIVKRKGDVTKINNKKDANKMMKIICDAKTIFTISNVDTTECIRSPSAPFTTSTLQQESSKYGLSVKETMFSAQKLYENGLITYMRTDSVNLSPDAIQNAKDYITKTYGEKYHKCTSYSHKKQNTQEAHEAIRPTDLFNTSIKGNKIGSSEIKLYNLIWRRTVSSQMSSAKIDKKTVQINISELDDYYFVAITETIKFDGFLKVYNTKFDVCDDDINAEKTIINKDVKNGDILTLNNCTCAQDYERPSTRFTEASLIKRLDPKELNIGRPSTYASIISIIQNRKYVEKKNIDGIEKSITIYEYTKGKKITEETKNKIIGQENDKLVPTTTGKLITEFLVKNFPEIMDYKFTARMETELDDIANGKLLWDTMLTNFYAEFHPLIIKNTTNILPDNNIVNIGVYYDKINNIEHMITATVGPHGPYLRMGKLSASISIEPVEFKKKHTNIDEIVKMINVANEFPKELGKHDRKKVVLRKGKNGFYFTVGTNKVSYSICNGDAKNSFDPKKFTIDDAIQIIKEKEKSMLWIAHDSNNEYSVRVKNDDSKYIMIKNNKNTKAKPIFLSLPDTIEPQQLTIKIVNEMVEKKKNIKKTQPDKKTEPRKTQKQDKKNTIKDDKIIVKAKKK